MPIKDETMGALILRAKAGDRAAFNALYREYVSPVYRYVFVRLRNKSDAEDVTQETFMKAFQAMARYRDERDGMLPYLFTIARNLLINHTRKKRPENALPEDIDKYAGSERTSRVTEEREVSEVIQDALGFLSEAEREVVELRFFGERSYAEIATLLGKREDAIRQHIARSLKKLREVLRKEDNE